MRWIFASTPEEQAHKKQLLERIDEFWSGFVAKAPDIEASFKPNGPELHAEWLLEQVSRIDGRIMWEIGPPLDKSGIGQLCLTCETERYLRPLLSTMLSRAPKIKGWAFFPYRLPGGIEYAEIAVKGRDSGSIEGWRVKLGRSGSKIDVTYLVPGIEKLDEDAARNSAFVATECLLGEQILDQWVDTIDVAPLRPSGGPGFSIKKLFRQRGPGQQGTNLPGYELSRIHALVCSLIDAHREQLPSTPWLQNLNDESPVWRAEMSPNSHRPGVALDDPILLAESIRGLFDALLARAFNSAAFSRCNEQIVGVKCMVGNGMTQEALAAKVSLYDVLDAGLREQKLGCTVGTSTGQRHNYVFLAVTDLVKGARAVQSVMAAEEVPLESWVFFPDPELCGEWLGAYPDTPSPSWIEE